MVGEEKRQTFSETPAPTTATEREARSTEMLTPPSKRPEEDTAQPSSAHSTPPQATALARGNIMSKSGVGTYTYHATKVHAVSSVNTGSATWNFAYDANGNMTSRNGTEITRVNAPGTSFTDTGLSAETTYSYSVVAIDGAGRLSAPGTAQATTSSEPTDPNATLVAAASQWRWQYIATA